MDVETDSISSVVLAERLGGGWFGDVHRGSQAPHGTVAVKVIDCERMKLELGISEWSALRDHLQREAESLRKAESAHVVRVHGVGATPNRNALHIVTELCDGSLLSLCEHGPMATGRVRLAVEHALLGLEALHARDMVHRDLKPGNLLYVGSITKLADFGLVSDALVNGYASLNGYTEHLAPEVHRDRVTSPRTDVWAMGLTIYRLLNGEPWYRAEKQRLGFTAPDGSTDAAAITAAVEAGGFASRLRWMPHVHDAWRRLVRRAMHDDSGSRFPDGGAMLTHFFRSIGTVEEPDWSCEYAGPLVRWSAPATTGRRIVVEWRRTNQRRHSVFAWSEAQDAATGRRRTFIGEENIAPSRAAGQLANFFAGRVST